MWKGRAPLWVWISFICKLFTVCSYLQTSTCPFYHCTRQGPSALCVHILLFDVNKKSSFFFSLNFQAIEYEVGAVLEVLPSQNPAAVDAFIERCNLDPAAFITVSSSLVYWLNLGDSSFAWSMHTSWFWGITNNVFA